MNPLTADEMACVATTVTGRAYTVEREPWESLNSGSLYPRFRPDIDSDHWKALVEWLADRLKEMKMQTPPDFYGYNTIACRMEEAIWNRDTTALQRMVLELRNPQ